MAQFAAQGRVKLLFNGEGVALEQKGDPFNNCMFTSIQPHTYNRRLGGPHLDSTRLYSSSSTNKAKRLNAEARLFVGGDEAGPGHDDAAEFESDDELACFRGLVLDISYRPVNVVCWKRAICLEYMEKADVLEYYDQTVNSPNGSFYIPAVLRVPHLLQIVKRRRIKNNLSRKNILCRDSFTCQYCSSRENLTIDHVLPIVRGGEWKWENLNEAGWSLFRDGGVDVTETVFNPPEWGVDPTPQVTACARCNSKKGQKTLEEANMKLTKVPKAPKDYDILAIPLTSAAIKMLKMRKGTPEEWLQYLSKPSSEP